jgi:hypothetical protein
VTAIPPSNNIEPFDYRRAFMDIVDSYCASGATWPTTDGPLSLPVEVQRTVLRYLYRFGRYDSAWRTTRNKELTNRRINLYAEIEQINLELRKL